MPGTHRSPLRVRIYADARSRDHLAQLQPKSVKKLVAFDKFTCVACVGPLACPRSPRVISMQTRQGALTAGSPGCCTNCAEDLPTSETPFLDITWISHTRCDFVRALAVGDLYVRSDHLASGKQEGRTTV